MNSYTSGVEGDKTSQRSGAKLHCWLHFFDLAAEGVHTIVKVGLNDAKYPVV